MTSTQHEAARDSTSERALLRLSGIQKAYGGVRALRGVDFEVRSGEVHALVGENGAGKSTLIRIVSGAETPDTGSIELGDTPLGKGSTAAALDLGIATVYQEPQLFAELTVVENVYIGRELRSKGRVDWKRQRAEAEAAFQQLGLDPRIVDVRAGDLRVAEQQLVSIAKALIRKPRILILDEPSAILVDHDIDLLFKAIQASRRDGVGVIYISHRLDEIKRIADRVTVLRDGEVVATQDVATTTIRDIAQLMVGKQIVTSDRRREAGSGDPVLNVVGLGYRSAFRDVTFEVSAGEILAVYGLVGSGNDELAQSLFGILPPTAGTVTVDGRRAALRSPRDAQNAGLGLVPANRKLQGVFGDKSIAFNLGLSSLSQLSRFTWVKRRGERRLAETYMARLAVKAPDSATPIASLSGGNQQKVVIGRQLATHPRVLVLQEPTQGVDVGAKAEIHRRVFDLASTGSAVVVSSTDLAEALTLADRLIVMRNRTVAASFERGAPSVDVLAAAAGDLDGGATDEVEEVS
ncbi:sugar ABC transporter ATP-binding protein [Streptomyces sp. NBC_01622]|uniref:sugar ABC transporter ATP-binding protein n=1 Tax=Streptomyces sp. NBC_01622 TaxID=2975903 RepID=UPI00386CE936|nr:sugar ABC transporter ATP-binding protein [Streptomyces sp. NBC_01622]